MNNIDLLETYPFLNREPYYDKETKEYDNRLFAYDDYDYRYTCLDFLPTGWRESFGIQLCEEIKAELIKYNWLYKYTLYRVDSAYGRLFWFDNGYPKGSRIPEIIEKYADLSEHTCIFCGKEATWASRGILSPYCNACKLKHEEPFTRNFIPLDEVKQINK